MKAEEQEEAEQVAEEEQSGIWSMGMGPAGGELYIAVRRACATVRGFF
jgi:hypothetical protein